MNNLQKSARNAGMRAGMKQSGNDAVMRAGLIAAVRNLFKNGATVAYVLPGIRAAVAAANARGCSVTVAEVLEAANK